jgi:uncharacterized membrane protein
MIFMALDHASMFIADQHFSEFWGLPLPDYGDPLSLFTRVISHLCAPGFFFLMGVGMQFFADSRRSQGWSEARIVRHFAIRGALLVGVDAFIVTPAWVLGSLESIMSDGPLPEAVPGSGGTVYFAVGVLMALGFAMILSSFAMRFSGRIACMLGLAIILGCQALLPGADRVAEPMPTLIRFLLVAGQDGHVVVVYPILPWFGVCLMGMAYGSFLKRDPQIALQRAFPAGIVGLVLFVLVRGAGGFGTYHPVAAGDWMSFLTVTKYPPSGAFLLLSLSANALFLWGLCARITENGRISQVLSGFGRTPLFFYVVHLYLYAVMGLCIPGSTSLAWMYPVWLLGLALLLPLCRRYHGFKLGTNPASFWRLF